MINNLLYCDDLVIFGESLREIQTGLDEIENFCSQNKLVINLEDETPEHRYVSRG